MNFCPECDSMLYYVEENNKLMNKCNICGYKDVSDSKVISSNVYKKENIQEINTKNYNIYDVSLSRTIHKECPNEDCASRKNKVLQESVFYSDLLTMKLVYNCVVCNTKWQYS